MHLSWGGIGGRSAWRGCVAVGLLLCAVASGATPAPGDDGLPFPRLTIVALPPVVVPGQPVHVRLEWALPDPAEPDPVPSADLGDALSQWAVAARSAGGVVWEGDLVPLRPGSLAGQITCGATLPLLPADLPPPGVFEVSSRYLVNLYSPCRWRSLTRAVPLPAIAVTPLPPKPAGTPPFTGLLGTWSATLTADRAQVSMGEPLAISLCLQGHGSTALFRPPLLSHPDLEVLEPQLERRAEVGTVDVRWTVIPTRVLLDPVRLGFSTFDGGRYACHRLEVTLDVRPDAPPQAGSVLPPPVLLRFHPMPESPTPAAGGALAGCLAAGLGGLTGLALAGAARRRDLQRSPAGLRQAALKRLQQMHLAHADDLPRVYHDLRTWLDLPAGAAAAEIAAALRPEHCDLADELHALETRRFSAAGTAVSPQRLHTLLRQLSCLAVLAALGLRVAAVLPLEESLTRVAEEAFRQRDFAQACNALTFLRQSGRESPELLLNLANVSWFCGRRIEALALYERAVRCAPRRQDCRDGLAWLRRSLPAEATATPKPWTLPLRDRLRPDEWLFLAGLLLGVGGCVGGLLRWWCRPVRYPLGVSAIAAFVCLWFALAQWTGTYRVGATARLTQAVALRAAPLPVAEALTPVVPAGTLVTPSGAYPGWVQVRTPTAEGWVPETGCILVW